MICDKCGEEVPYENDMLVLLVKAGAIDPLVAVIVPNSRHLLPTDGCEGSPSRAQYLEGQPRDTRGYDYYPQIEPVFRAAFAGMQADAAERTE